MQKPAAQFAANFTFSLLALPSAEYHNYAMGFYSQSREPHLGICVSIDLCLGFSSFHEDPMTYAHHRTYALRIAFEMT